MYQCVVVGSGPGGAVTAFYLAQAGFQVVVIEEGAQWDPNACRPFSLDEMEKKYRNSGLSVVVGPPHINFVEGRCVGGGSEINSGLYHRLPDPIREEWEKTYRIREFTQNHLAPHFEVCEEMLSVSYHDQPHGLGALKLKQGADQLGWQCAEIPRWIRNGERQSMSQTYLKKFTSLGGTILSNTRVTRLQRSGRNWQLTLLQGRQTQIIDAEFVFVASGAIQTPLLLRRSGFTQNIGNSIRLHPTLKVTAEYNESVTRLEDGVGSFQLKEFSPDMSFGCSISSPPYVALSLIDYPDISRIECDWSKFSVYYGMICSSTVGTVRACLNGTDPMIRYQLTRFDLAQLGLALERLCQVLWRAGSKRLYPSVPGLPALSSPSDVSAARLAVENGNVQLITIHVFGSCPMGENRDLSAVDSFGMVHGQQGLYISDASLFCGSPSVNPQGTLMAIVRRNVLHFINKTKG